MKKKSQPVEANDDACAVGSVLTFAQTIVGDTVKIQDQTLMVIRKVMVEYYLVLESTTEKGAVIRLNEFEYNQHEAVLVKEAEH
jgi:hypothetical protein